MVGGAGRFRPAGGPGFPRVARDRTCTYPRTSSCPRGSSAHRRLGRLNVVAEPARGALVARPVHVVLADLTAHLRTLSPRSNPPRFESRVVASSRRRVVAAGPGSGDKIKQGRRTWNNGQFSRHHGTARPGVRAGVLVPDAAGTGYATSASVDGAGAGPGVPGVPGTEPRGGAACRSSLDGEMVLTSPQPRPS